MNALASPDQILTAALVRVLAWLQGQHYQFITVTPATHTRVNARPYDPAQATLRDAFGWSRPFPAALLPPELCHDLRQSALVVDGPDGLLRSRVRFSTVGGRLFAHSAYPTVEEDAVFLGPDTYRFAALIEEELRRAPLPGGGIILDVGCGAGGGGIVAAGASAAAQPQLLLTDINPRALQFAAANAAHAGCGGVQLHQGDLFAPVAGRRLDFVIANPPYLNDAGQRAYRHGGGRWGEGLSERIVREGMPCLAPGGRLVLYTGVAIVDGRDTLLESLRDDLMASGWPWRYRELDPDVFGEELDEPAYAGAERIAVTALVLQRPHR